MSVDVLNIKINLEKRETDSESCFANAHTRNPELMQRLRQANGIMLNTVRDQVIVVDVPYSSLYLPDWFKQYSFDFNKEKITGMAITANLSHGYGTSLLQIFDFEIY